MAMLAQTFVIATQIIQNVDIYKIPVIDRGIRYMHTDTALSNDDISKKVYTRYGVFNVAFVLVNPGYDSSMNKN